VAGGSAVYYQFIITNTGNVPLSPVNITDPTVSTASCTFTDPLPVAGTTTCVVGPLTAVTLAGTYPNTATANGDYGGITYNSDPSSAQYIVAAAPSLSLTKVASPLTYDTLSQTITYSYVITNTGNVTLMGPFSITDDKASVTCTQPADNALSPLETMDCTASYSITQADLDNGSVTNKATATNGTVTSNEATATVTAVSHPVLTLDKSADPMTYDSVGDVISYNYLMTNSGNVTLTSPFTISDDKATNESCPPITSLAPGDSITCTSSYTITQADLDAGWVKNTAQGHANGIDSNFDDETVNAVQSPALTLVKAATPATYDSVGDVISYSYDVKNTGNVTLAGPVTVSDDKATVTCPAGGLALAASMTCTASYTIDSSA